MPEIYPVGHLRPLIAVVIVAACSLAAPALADTLLQFPKDAPAFTFELPDTMKGEYQPDGTLNCTAKDGSLLRGVVQALPNISNDQGLLIGLNGATRVFGPKLLSGDVHYPAITNETTPSGIHTITAEVYGKRDGADYAIGFIVFSKAGKYYELTVSGVVDTLVAFKFPRSFRQTLKLTP